VPDRVVGEHGEVRELAQQGVAVAGEQPHAAGLDIGHAAVATGARGSSQARRGSSSATASIDGCSFGIAEDGVATEPLATSS
jgi:hypothetical protein